ncbi:MAG: hypothetical protein JXR73_08570, partial [Candidatus Omnitrophica bacterium]|nr:hypothetical protein [Candidatus Omnitrophota bacterium]
KGVRILYGKRYQDKDGQWKTSTSFAPNEIHTAMYVLQRVDAYLAQRSSVRQRNRPRAPRSAHPAAGPDPEAYYAEMQGDEFLEII